MKHPTSLLVALAALACSCVSPDRLADDYVDTVTGWGRCRPVVLELTHPEARPGWMGDLRVKMKAPGAKMSNPEPIDGGVSLSIAPGVELEVVPVTLTLRMSDGSPLPEMIQPGVADGILELVSSDPERTWMEFRVIPAAGRSVTRRAKDVVQ